ncbi:hypothetical protein COO60DRAFT_1522836 [Scenedesmus sp. NREL 46B-D3]|nr:hypothetical protein COO60DRAFT_1522836 [Scenedesmus sp. NREL 46B-D3]
MRAHFGGASSGCNLCPDSAARAAAEASAAVKAAAAPLAAVQAAVATCGSATCAVATNSVHSAALRSTSPCALGCWRHASSSLGRHSSCSTCSTTCAHAECRPSGQQARRSAGPQDTGQQAHRSACPQVSRPPLQQPCRRDETHDAAACAQPQAEGQRHAVTHSLLDRASHSIR